MTAQVYSAPQLEWVSDCPLAALCGSFYVDGSGEKYDEFQDITW